MVYVRFLTKLVANCGDLGRVGGFTDPGRVAAPDTEAVGLPLGQIEQRKARGLDWDLRVHPLPAVCARHTLTNKDTRIHPSAVIVTDTDPNSKNE